MTDSDTKKTEAETSDGTVPPETDALDAATGDVGAEEVREEVVEESQVAALRDENARLKDQMLRALAEVENTRRRAERDREETAKFAIGKFARDLLNVADNLRRALESVPADAAADNPVLNTLAEGVAATERELLAAFEKHGLTRIDPVDQKFDPNFHQAMFEVPNSGKVPGTVVQVMAPGYVLNGRLVRPAMVGVAGGEVPQKVDTTA
ncbi:MAG TPA: nucleotide exchange factor GrpE [Alphaproteobacteria bacterium]|nr:nucleotide exchange factor GrpE [Alphaproteobacteria bacterium]